MMIHSRFAYIAIAVVALVGVAATVRNRQAPEPVYRGRTLTEYVRVLWRTDPYVCCGWFSEEQARAQKEAEQAIREIGPAALPTLVRFLRARPRYNPRWGVVRGWFRQHFPQMYQGDNRRYQLADQAETALLILGPKSEPAFDEVMRHAYSLNRIAEAIGESTVPKLTNALTNSDVRAQQRMMSALYWMRHLPAAQAALITLTNHPDSNVCRTARWSLSAEAQRMTNAPDTYLRFRAEWEVRYQRGME